LCYKGPGKEDVMKCRECKGEGSRPDPATGENQGCLNCGGWGNLDPDRARSEPKKAATYVAFELLGFDPCPYPADFLPILIANSVKDDQDTPDKTFLGILHDAKCIVCGGLINLCPHGPKAKDPKMEMKNAFFDLDHDDLGTPTAEL
jgi:hypothetical protein